MGKFFFRISPYRLKTIGNKYFIGIMMMPLFIMVMATMFMIIIMVMSSSMGKGAAFSAIPVAVLQGSMPALAGLMRPVMTEGALANLSLVGNVLIFCVGINLVFGKKVKVANLLPAIVIALAAAFLPV